MTSARVRAQGIKEIGEASHDNGLIRVYIPELLPIRPAGLSITPVQRDVIVC